MKSSMGTACVALTLISSSISAPLAFAQNSEPGIVLINELSPGVRLYGVDEKRVSAVNGRTVKLPNGSHTLNLRYAYNFSKSHNGPWVARYDFKCEFPDAGTYRLRSKDSAVAETAPTIWVETSGTKPPVCNRVGA